jgi:hypothetical protein
MAHRLRPANPQSAEMQLQTQRPWLVLFFVSHRQGGAYPPDLDKVYFIHKCPQKGQFVLQIT